MLVRPRLRSLDGCVTCKKRRKKCDETRPICGGCKRLRLRCSWKDIKDVPPNGEPVSNVRLTELYDTKRIRPDPTLNPGPNLSAFTDLMCGTYVLEKCYNGFNLPVDSMWASHNGTTIRSTLSFAPAEESLAWGCMVCQGLLILGNRYRNRRIIEAGLLQKGAMLRKISAAIADENKRHNLDTVAAIDNLFASTATTIGFTKPDVDCEASSHLIGFLTVLDTMQPDQFQDEHALALLEHVRLTKVLVSLMLRHKTVLTSEPWKTVPWATSPRAKSTTQRLVDLLCDVASLQAKFDCTFPFSKLKLHVNQKDIWKQLGQLLTNLHDWRQSVEPEVIKLPAKVPGSTIYDALTHEDVEYKSDTTGIQLYELGIFNLLLIYLCQFLTQNYPVLNAVNAFACDKAQYRCKSSQYNPKSLLSPSVLPLFAPDDRIRGAAAEIVTICEWVHHEGKNGLALAYLAVPMLVARNILADIGDARSIRLGEVLTWLSDFWSGRSW